jgi:hypothetical protein
MPPLRRLSVVDLGHLAAAVAIKPNPQNRSWRSGFLNPKIFKAKAGPAKSAGPVFWSILVSRETSLVYSASIVFTIRFRSSIDANSTTIFPRR